MGTASIHEAYDGCGFEFAGSGRGEAVRCASNANVDVVHVNKALVADETGSEPCPAAIRYGARNEVPPAGAGLLPVIPR